MIESDKLYNKQTLIRKYNASAPPSHCFYYSYYNNSIIRIQQKRNMVLCQPGKVRIKRQWDQYINKVRTLMQKCGCAVAPACKEIGLKYKVNAHTLRTRYFIYNKDNLQHRKIVFEDLKQLFVYLKKKGLVEAEIIESAKTYKGKKWGTNTYTVEYIRGSDFLNNILAFVLPRNIEKLKGRTRNDVRFAEVMKQDIAV